MIWVLLAVTVVDLFAFAWLADARLQDAKRADEAKRRYEYRIYLLEQDVKHALGSSRVLWSLPTNRIERDAQLALERAKETS